MNLNFPKRKFVLTGLLAVFLFLGTYQERLLFAERIWDWQNVQNYQITVRTTESFGEHQHTTFSCIYTVIVKADEIFSSETNCNDDISIEQRANFLPQDVIVPGLFSKANQFKAYQASEASGLRRFSVKIGFPYMFPKYLQYSLDEDGVYQLVIEVVDFQALKQWLKRKNRQDFTPGDF